MKVRETLDQLVRRQRSRLTAQLVRRFGYGLLPIIEDAIQVAIIKALERWEFEGLPDNAGAWLYRAAYHRAIDLPRKSAPELECETAMDEPVSTEKTSLNGGSDAELELMLICCQPGLAPVEQQLLMLNLVVGLDHAELATLILHSRDAVAQRLARIKRRNKRNYEGPRDPDWDSDNINSIITTLYTAFNVGYFPRSGDQLIRDDVAVEACRLSASLADKSPARSAHKGRLYAHSALMSIQCSRLAARESVEGEPILLQYQDVEKRDQRYIARGNKFLQLAMQTNNFSEFHIEAAIAAIHASKTPAPDWQQISSL